MTEALERVSGVERVAFDNASDRFIVALSPDAPALEDLRRAALRPVVLPRLRRLLGSIKLRRRPAPAKGG